MPGPFPHHDPTWLVQTLSSRARLAAPPRRRIANALRAPVRAPAAGKAG